MSRLTKGIIFTAAGFALTACGGGSTSDSAAENLFLLEPTAAGFAGSGLAFADEESGTPQESLAPGDTFDVRFLRYVNVEGESDAELVFTTETVTLVQDGSGDQFVNVTFDGETVQFAFNRDEFFTDSAVLESGQVVNGFEALSGDYSAIYGLYTYVYDEAVPTLGGINSEGSLVVGFETDPTVVASRDETASFAGLFEGYGVVVPDDGSGVLNEVYVEGGITMEVAFADSTLDAAVDGDAYVFGADEAPLEFSGTTTDANIVGNGFLGDLDIVCAGDLTCSSDSEIGGAFYGPDGSEIAGLIAFDVSAEDAESDATSQFLAGAGFGLTETSE